MEFSRRKLLMTGGVAVPLSFVTRNLVAQSDDIKKVVVCLTGVNARTPPGVLLRIIGIFLEKRLPVSCVYELDQTGNDQNLLAGLIRDIALREPGLFEVMVAFTGGEIGARYFQMREAAELRKQVVNTFYSGVASTERIPVISVFDQRQGAFLDFPAFRSAGFRAIVSPSDENSTATLEIIGREQLQIGGGISMSLADDASWDMNLLEGQLKGRGDVLLPVSLTGIGDGDADGLVVRIAAMADKLADETGGGRVLVSRPMDLLMHASAQHGPSIGVMLYPPTSDDPDDPVRSFARDLVANGISYTTMTNAPVQEDAGTAEYCGPYTDDPQVAGEMPLNCSVQTTISPIDDTFPYPVVLIPHDAENGWTGMRADARFQITTYGRPDMTAAELLPLARLTDEVIAIQPQMIATYLQRATLVQRLGYLRDLGRIKLHSVKGFVAHVVAADPFVARFQSTRKRMFSDPPVLAAISLSDRANLMEDARLAWRYIDRYTHDTSGLCAGTARGGRSPLVHKQATMWDLASQIHGIIAAHRLAIIDTIEALHRIARLLDHLPTGQIDGLSLPPLIFSTTSARSVRAGFDLCDTSRFCIALSAAKDAGLVSPDRAQAVFDNWDINGAVRDGHPHNHSKGQWVDTYLSHCAPYTRRGLALWGLDAASPYLPLDDADYATSRIRLLDRVAYISHYGTEPMLLEAIELGPTPESSFLSDVLFDAQLSYFERTGTLKCVSETLLDFEPWFSYQGMRVDRFEDDGWVIASPNPAERFKTDSFKAKAEVISSKSAFLWAAVYPHPHSSRLLHFIRENARVEGTGFSAGVYTGTSEQMADYCDINTNGIILTAIAHMLSG